jgi:hypothetical protein
MPGEQKMRIEDLFSAAERRMEEIGAAAFVERLYSGRDDPELTRIKEDWILGAFTIRYNATRSPSLVYARRNAAGTDHADFSVYGTDCSMICDIEVTGLWLKPTVDEPQGYEDYSPYPAVRDENNPDVIHLDIDQPPIYPPYSQLKWVLKGHLRSHYSPYWLVMWDNDHTVTHPNLVDLASRVQRIMRARQAGWPSNLLGIWLLDENSRDLKFISPDGAVVE